jgi:hypothetical protein
LSQAKPVIIIGPIRPNSAVVTKFCGPSLLERGDRFSRYISVARDPARSGPRSFLFFSSVALCPRPSYAVSRSIKMFEMEGRWQRMIGGRAEDGARWQINGGGEGRARD